MYRTIGQQILKELEILGVEYIYGVPSGNTGYIYDCIEDYNMKLIVTKSESGATYSAARYSDLSGKLGVSILSGGVGATNGLNGIADAYVNKLPMLIITGNTTTQSRGKGCVQELETTNITKSITKYSKTILNDKEIIKELKLAIKLATTKPCGPVHISIPMDLPMKTYDEGYTNSEIETNENEIINDDESIKIAIDKLNNTEKGLILVGHGAKDLNNEIDYLSEKLGWYVMTTPQGKSNVNHINPLYIGNFGFYSSDFANNYIKSKDIETILVLGSSLGESATQNFDENFYKNRTIIQIDHDVEILNRNSVENKLPVLYNLKDAIQIINNNVKEKDLKEKYIFDKSELNKQYINNHDGISIRRVLETLPNILNKSTTYLCDIGEFMNHTFKYLQLPIESKFVSSLNYGSMGHSIGGVVGAALSGKTNKYAVIVGDGSYYMNGMELLTAKEYNLPIIYFIINNAKYNYVDKGQSFVFGRTIPSIHFNRVSIAKISESMGIKSYQINVLEELENISSELHNCNEPIVVELVTYGTEESGECDRFKAIAKQTDK
ncbi:thiamine pyrophosphate-binding protein [Clostridium sp. AL.422]|uniref:thiamine pyrophosphate-binding protein n=1 Tax=Clostridium TaxID=1485 RepID=UPI00293DB489|nr:MULTISPECIES: thiamine pyrophosphate-binding protein [unclassified Clostridium]MDV4152538.1 thiamine pyrophosphate-binding protein [Clostridium sp. AL.422]